MTWLSDFDCFECCIFDFFSSFASHAPSSPSIFFFCLFFLLSSQQRRLLFLTDFSFHLTFPSLLYRVLVYCFIPSFLACLPCSFCLPLVENNSPAVANGKQEEDKQLSLEDISRKREKQNFEVANQTRSQGQCHVMFVQ